MKKLKIVAILNQPAICYVYYIYTESNNRDYVRKKIRKVIYDSFPDFTNLIGLITVYSKDYPDILDGLFPDTVFDQFYL